MDESLWNLRRVRNAVRLWLWWMVIQDRFYPSFWYQFRFYRRPGAAAHYTGRKFWEY